MKTIFQQRGMSLLEVLLVLAVASTLTMAAVSVYQSMSVDENATSIKAQVNILFTAMKKYHQANCADQVDPKGNVDRVGSLSPSSITYPPMTPVVITQSQIAASQVIIGGGGGGPQGGVVIPPSNDYLSTIPVANSVLDASVGMNGYLLQFNPINPQLVGGGSSQPGAMQTYACWNYGSSSNTTYDMGPYYTSEVACSATLQTIPSSQVIIWQAQVAVKLRSDLNAAVYRGLLGADCVSSADPVNAGGVLPCSSNPQAGQYLVWDRLPSQISPTTSGYWMNKPLENQFNSQYTHDPLYEMYYITYQNTWPNAPAPNANPYVTTPPYYLCGG